MATSNSSDLTSIPKFQAIAPQSLADWMSFLKWLVNLWRKAQASIDAPQSIVITPQSSAGSAQQSQEALAAALASSSELKLPMPISEEETLRAALVAQQQQPRGCMFGDDLSGLAEYALAKPPYPSKPWAAEGTHADRLSLYPATAYPDGSRFFETDRKVTYICVAGNWLYASGTMADMLSNQPILGSYDSGFLYRVTTGTGGVAYNHVARWTGSAWEAGDNFGGFFEDFAFAPSEPGWQICDGSGTTCLQIIAGSLTETAFTTPNLTTGVYRKGAAAYTGIIAAAGTISMSGGTVGASSAGTPAGSVSAPLLMMDLYTPSGACSTPNFTGSALATHQHELPFQLTGSSLHTIPVLSFGSGSSWMSDGMIAEISNSTFAAVALCGAASGGTPSGTVSAPVFTGTGRTPTGTATAPAFTGSVMGTHTHSLSGLSATLTGDPINNIAVISYFRR